MVPLSEYFRSVELIWGIWIVALVLALGLTWKALRALDFKQWRSVFKEEDGAAYSLSYVLVFPIYVLLIILVIETTLILTVKMGTVYAAYAAARSEIVWSSLRQNDPGLVRRKAKQAAVQAMVPYASSWKAHARLAALDFPAARENEFFQAYKRYYNKPDNYRRYITAKYRWADWATTVQRERIPLSNPSAPWHADIKTTVKYKMPLHMPAIARLLGTRQNRGRGTFYLIEITSSATLQDEAPQNNSMTLGLTYDPR